MRLPHLHEHRRGRTWQAVRHGFPDRLRTAFEAMCLEDWGDLSPSSGRAPPVSVVQRRRR